MNTIQKKVKNVLLTNIYSVFFDKVNIASAIGQKSIRNSVVSYLKVMFWQPETLAISIINVLL
ncbi:hypothetical protein [Emticicia soli]|uniref:Uncharacterized protein n=1 Tax=Emticicia soli TaxID=2027878 RepID=A0ABW5JEV3_9BACT